jgi:tetrapyrrole methylase family protein/MazG family protein
MRSYKVQQKAAQVGFDWDNAEDIFDKVNEEILELKMYIRVKMWKE